MFQHAHREFTTAEVSFQRSPDPNRKALPEFVRLPASGKRCPISSLSRTALNGLILGPNPPVKSVSLRRKGALRGVRLIVVESLLDYLHGLNAEDGTAEEAKEDAR